ncbi:MAG: ribonuclease T2 family protein [Marinibacterium sp.]
MHLAGFRWLAVLVLIAGIGGGPARASDFDYYVLALSWSPNWCAMEGDADAAPQCDGDAGWLMHGLWPQYEQGWPSSCATSATPPSRRQTAAMADIMGSGGLAWYQWKKHGTCSGLAAEDYFALARLAYERVNRPAVLRKLDQPVRLPASVIEDAFLRDNPDLSADGLTVTCRDGYVQEVRICLTRDLTPRDCAPDSRRDCTLDRALFTPVR